MTNLLWRSLLIISSGLAGLYLGSWAGAAYFVSKDAGLAGGAIVLMYAIAGLAVFAVAGAVVAFRLGGRNLRNTALIIAAPVLLFYLVLTAIALMKSAAEREPDEAFAPAGQFTVAMERVDLSDPYLFARMEVDSESRRWTQTGPAPEHKICSAEIRSKELIEIRNALDVLLALGAEELAGCNDAEEPVIKRLHWNLIDKRLPPGGSALPEKGALDANAICLHRHEIARAFSLVEKISLRTGGNVTCR